jgi:hypothetical protein
MGDEMIAAINEMAFCNDDCGDVIPVSPGIVSIGNRVWNDLNRDGINNLSEPGIPGVSVVLWSDSDGDGIPDWQGFRGVEVTDADGHYRFSGLQPGNYVTFVWSVANWNIGEPLNGFVSSNGFVANANNDIDLDNNGSGNPFTDIMSGIITLTIDGEPLNDGDPFDCFFDYDSSGNNTVDFGFFDPGMTVGIDDPIEKKIQMFPNPVIDKLTVKNNFSLCQIKIFDMLGRIHITIQPTTAIETYDLSKLPKGLYIVRLSDESTNYLNVQKIIKL